jgi:hypothetical protein
MNRYLMVVLALGLSFVAKASTLSGIQSHSSGYLIEEQANYRLTFPEADKVGVERDANQCSVDEFGRATGCSRVLFPTTIYTAKELASKDGLKLFELSSDLRLVVQKTGLAGASLFLLKVDAQGVVQKRIALYADFY